MTATRRTIPRALLVCALTPAVLSACTGPDAGMGFGPDGPIPPAPIGSSSTYGAPVRVGNPVGRVSDTEMAAAQVDLAQVAQALAQRRDQRKIEMYQIGG